MALSNDEVLSLMAGSRTKGSYDDALAKFIKSDEPGVNPREEWPSMFGEKNANTLAQGFTNAIRRVKTDEADQIKVINRDGDVFVIHLGRVHAAQTVAA